MKRRLSFMLTVVFTLLLISGCSGNREVTGSEQSEADLFAEFTTNDIDGNEITQDIFAEHELTLVNIWATFCGPCINELPVLEDIYQKYASENIGVVGLLIDTETSPRSAGLSESMAAEGKDILGQTGATFPQLSLPEALVDTAIGQVNTFPTSYFVDKNGNIVGNAILGANDKDSWEALIERHRKALAKRNEG